MLTITRKTKGLYYLEYNGRFVESFDKKRQAQAYLEKLEKSKLLPT